ncbi:MAG TPA: hypothetical protein VHZ78_15750 [Rhizomicrobium sp.]|jgi:hypothetical protein|nr:hypothetical protein [Rhizomicrobium sp.]
MKFIRILAFLTASMAFSEQALAGDGCNTPIYSPTVSVRFQNAGKSGSPGAAPSIGLFEIANKGEKSVIFPGDRSSNAFRIWYPDAVLEAFDAAGTWHNVDEEPPGSFIMPPGRLRIAPHGRAVIQASIRSFTNFAPDSVSLRRSLHFRLLLADANTNVCFASSTFVLP